MLVPESSTHRSHGSFFVHVGTSRLFLPQFPGWHKVQTLDVSRLPNTHGSICCLHHLDCTISPFTTSQCPKVKRCFDLEIACSRTSSPPRAMSSTALQSCHGIFCCVLLKTKTHGSKTDVSNPWRQQEISSSILSYHLLVDQLFQAAAPNTTRFSWGSIRRHSDEEWLFSLDRSPVLHSSCTSSNCTLCPWVHTDCRVSQNPPGLVSENVILCPGGQGR